MRMKVIVAALVLNLLNLVPALACTTLLVAKGASQDGSIIVAHSDDSELFDQRLVYVPAADHKPGSRMGWGTSTTGLCLGSDPG